MIAAASLRAALEERAGEGAMLDAAARARWSVAGVEPLAVVQPAAVEAVAAVLAFCSEEGIPVEPAGAGTWLAGARRPPAPPLVLSTARLTGTVDYEPADLVVEALAGTTLDGLERELGESGQVLPLDPPRLPGATLGATVALGAAGPLRAAHRTPRDLLLGVQLVTGDGRVVRFGGRVVKNVAGYDVVRLMAGSRGTLGVITSAALLLRAAPAVDRTFAASASTPAEAAALALAVRDRIGGDAVDVLSTTGAGLDDAVAGAAWAVLVRLRGSAEAVAEEAARLAELTPAREVEAGVWSRLSREEAEARTYLRLADRPVQLRRTLERAAELGRPGVWRIAAHGADGIVRLWQGPPAGEAGVPTADAGTVPSGLAMADAAGLAAAVSAAAVEMAEVGGTLLCPILPPALREAIDLPPGAEARALGLMAALRRTFDPAGILSPGRHAF